MHLLERKKSSFDHIFTEVYSFYPKRSLSPHCAVNVQQKKALQNHVHTSWDKQSLLIPTVALHSSLICIFSVHTDWCDHKINATAISHPLIWKEIHWNEIVIPNCFPADTQKPPAYCQTCNIRCIKFQNLNVLHLLSFSNPLKPGVMSRIKI